MYIHTLSGAFGTTACTNAWLNEEKALSLQPQTHQFEKKDKYKKTKI